MQTLFGIVLGLILFVIKAVRKVSVYVLSIALVIWVWAMDAKMLNTIQDWNLAKLKWICAQFPSPRGDQAEFLLRTLIGERSFIILEAEFVVGMIFFSFYLIFWWGPKMWKRSQMAAPVVSAPTTL